MSDFDEFQTVFTYKVTYYKKHVLLYKIFSDAGSNFELQRTKRSPAKLTWHLFQRNIAESTGRMKKTLRDASK